MFDKATLQLVLGACNGRSEELVETETLQFTMAMTFALMTRSNSNLCVTGVYSLLKIHVKNREENLV